MELVWNMAVEMFRRFSSESLGDPGGFQGVGHIFAGFFAAEPRSRKNLRGIGELKRVKRAADALHGSEVRLAEHF